MVDTSFKEQVTGIFASLGGEYIFNITLPPRHEDREDMLELLTAVADCSDKVSCQVS